MRKEVEAMNKLLVVLTIVILVGSRVFADAVLTGII